MLKVLPVLPLDIKKNNNEKVQVMELESLLIMRLREKIVRKGLGEFAFHSAKIQYKFDKWVLLDLKITIKSNHPTQQNL